MIEDGLCERISLTEVTGVTNPDSDLLIERSRVSLRQKVTGVLRQAITGGRFPPGSRLIERELCALTGVSRTSVREALRHLEAEGLVETINNRGPIVARLSLDEARHIYEIREALEPLAAELFAERGSDEEVAALNDGVAALKAALVAEDRAAMARATNGIYEILLTGCGNPIVHDVIRSLHARVGLLRTKSTSYPGRAPLSVEEMAEIAAAITRRDPEAARTASARHVRNARNAALAVLQASESLSGSR
jgi:DNA-binding GntR family transcriptional regulator